MYFVFIDTSWSILAEDRWSPASDMCLQGHRVTWANIGPIRSWSWLVQLVLMCACGCSRQKWVRSHVPIQGPGLIGSQMILPTTPYSLSKVTWTYQHMCSSVNEFNLRLSFSWLAAHISIQIGGRVLVQMQRHTQLSPGPPTANWDALLRRSTTLPSSTPANI